MRHRACRGHSPRRGLRPVEIACHNLSSSFKVIVHAHETSAPSAVPGPWRTRGDSVLSRPHAHPTDSSRRRIKLALQSAHAARDKSSTHRLARVVIGSRLTLPGTSALVEIWCGVLDAETYAATPQAVRPALHPFLPDLIRRQFKIDASVRANSEQVPCNRVRRGHSCSKAESLTVPFHLFGFQLLAVRSAKAGNPKFPPSRSMFR